MYLSSFWDLVYDKNDIVRRDNFRNLGIKGKFVKDLSEFTQR